MMKRTLFGIFLLFLTLSLFGFVADAADMTSYCSVPPYVRRDIAPNIIIILDNSKNNGLAAYDTTVPGAITNSVQGFEKYNPIKEYFGLFKSKEWYYYDGSRFVPASIDPTSTNYNADAVFEGNLLNWVATSKYDLIMGVLEGGKSTSRQPSNINTLVGYNQGNWSDSAHQYIGTKIVIYQGETTDSYTNPVLGPISTDWYACEFDINGNITVSDSLDYYTSVGWRCGLILGTPVRPKATTDTGVKNRYISFNSLDINSDMYAKADVTGTLDDAVLATAAENLNASRSGQSHEMTTFAGRALVNDSKQSYGQAEEETSYLTRIWSFVNYLMGLGAEDAWAAQPVTIIDPKKTSPTLPDGVLNSAYSYTVVASGGQGCYSWSVSAGALPPGLSLDPIGVLSGTPTTSGVYSFDLFVQGYVYDTSINDCDFSSPIGLNGSDFFTVTLNIPDIDTMSYISPPGTHLSAAVRYLSYSYQVVVDGALGTKTFSATGLPTGLSINSATGVISGITSVLPNTYGPVTITVTDSGGTPNLVGVFDIEVLSASASTSAPLEITSPEDGVYMPDAAKGTLYVGYQAAAWGGQPPYTWSEDPGFHLPSGLSIDTSGYISGTATGTVGEYSVVLRVTDSGGETAMATVKFVVYSPVAITDPADGGSLNDGEVGVDYAGYQPAAMNGRGSYSWSALNLPDGLGIANDSGYIDGVPTASNTYDTITLTVKDSTGDTDSVNAKMVVHPHVRITAPGDGDYLTEADNGTAYKGFLATAADGNAAAGYSWNATGLPAGMSIVNGTGFINGTPTDTVKTYYPVTITVSDNLGGTDSVDVYLTLNDALSISNLSDGDSLTEADLGVDYKGFIVNATGGNADEGYEWSIDPAYPLPGGLSIDSTSGYISGKPLATDTVKTYDVTIIVKDNLGATDSVDVKLTLNDVLTITSPAIGNSLTPADLNIPYKGYVAQATGGNADDGYIWDWSSPTGLPPGLTLDPDSGYIHGKPTAEGTYDYITITVKDNLGATASVDTSIVVNPQLEITAPAISESLTEGDVGTDYLGYTAIATGGNAVDGYTWSWGPLTDLPPGLTLDKYSGHISGIPSSANTYYFTLTVEDNLGATALVDTSILINPKLVISSPSGGTNLTGAIPGVEYPVVKCIATGGNDDKGYIWSIDTTTTDPLPTGMYIDPGSGDIYGKPNLSVTPKIYKITIKVQDTLKAEATTSVYLEVYPPLEITDPDVTTTYLPNAQRTVAYTFYATVAGGTGGYIWNATGLPDGIAMNKDTGEISGTTLVHSGTYNNIKIAVQDSTGYVATRTVSLVVDPEPLALSWPPDGTDPTCSACTSPFVIPDAILNSPYINHFEAMALGGVPPYTWTWKAAPTAPDVNGDLVPDLPPGMTINPITGVISGTPTTHGFYPFSIIVIDSDGSVDTIGAGMWEENPGSTIRMITAWDGDLMPDATVGERYPGFSIGTYYGEGQNYWTVSGLPSGMGYNSRSGLINGIPDPLTEGDYDVKITVDSGSTTCATLMATDPAYDPVTGYLHCTATLKLKVLAAATTVTITLPTYTPGTAEILTAPELLSTINNPGGTAPQVISNAPSPGGTAPPNISSVPPPGAGTVMSELSDVPAPSYTAPPSLFGGPSLTITLLAPMINAPTASTILEATQGLEFKGYTAHATRGTGVYTWSESSTNPLPAGITIDPVSGIINGTPSASPGDYTVEIVATDALVPAYSGTRQFIFTIYSPDHVYIDSPTYGAILPQASEKMSYQGYQPSATGGVGPFTWSIDPGAPLPDGLSINASTGYISGTPLMNTAGTYTVVIQLTDNSTGIVDTATVTLEVSKVPVSSQSFNIRVCAGTADKNCTTVSSGATIKTGLLQGYFRANGDDLAHFGLMDFQAATATTTKPVLEECISFAVDTENNTATSTTVESSFHTDVENAVPTSATNKLVDALYGAVVTYMGAMSSGESNPSNTSGPVCDPFRESGTATAEPDPQSCRQNFVLILTDGQGANSGTKVFGAGSGKYDTSPLPDDCQGLTYNLATNACFGKKIGDFRTIDLGANEISGIQNVSTYIVQVNPNPSLANEDILRAATGASGGVYYGVTDPSTLQDTLQDALQDIIKRAASGTAASVLASAEGRAGTLMQAVYYPRRRFPLPADHNIEQEVSWIGRLANYWFYTNPHTTVSNMREETTGDQTLDVIQDYIAALYYDADASRVMAERWEDVDGDNKGDNPPITPDITFEELGALWEAGIKLWKRDLSTDPRTIYVNLNGTSTGATINATTKLASVTTDLANDSTVRTLLDVTDLDSSGSTVDEATDLIKFLHGYPEDTANYPDGYAYRSRQIKIDLNGNEEEDTDPFGTGDPNENESVSRVWKLGDILNSTPRIVHWEKVSDYDEKYGDKTYKRTDPSEPAGYVDTAQYKQRGMGFAGSNDGMLHAFKLGQILQADEPDPGLFSAMGGGGNVAAVINGTNLGREEWAFIPLQVLPYLKYQMRNDYCHIYTVDLTPIIADVAIGTDTAGEDSFCPVGTTEYWKCLKKVSTWRTIIIGGMRLGGACKNQGATATVDLNLDGSIDDEDIVQTPIPDYGYSSYFALDITDPENPNFLWEFSDPTLGFATSGATVTRMAWKYDTDGDGEIDQNNDRNGRWIAVFGSGPTGPIISEDLKYQNLARSDQNLKFFVLDVATGELLGTVDTGIQKAFSGSLLDVSTDFHFDYSDSHLYAGYVSYNSATGKWNSGGIGRLQMNDDMDPANWTWWPLMDGIGPVTTSPEVAWRTSKNELWVFFATGRYYYDLGGGDTDDSATDGTSQRHLFGVKDPCAFTGLDGRRINCEQRDADGINTLVDFTELDMVTDFANAGEHTVGWYIPLFEGGHVDFEDENGVLLDTEEYRPERVITDPVFSSSLHTVFFTTYMPYSNGCKIGGDSFIQFVDAATGGVSPVTVEALLQSSTGSIEKVTLRQGVSHGTLNEIIRSRRVIGVPPMAQGTTIFANPGGKPRILHIRER